MLKAAHGDMVMSRMQAFRWFKKFRNRREYTNNAGRIISVV
jgi:UDP-2,3-diacylglucosamine pyrophosphatase LpxH